MATHVNEKRPRHYVAEIIALTSPDERRDALARVPESMRATVEREVRFHFERKHSNKRTFATSPSTSNVKTSPGCQTSSPSKQRGQEAIQAARKALS